MQNMFYYGKKYGKDIILFILILICLALIVYNTFKKEDGNEEISSLAFSNISVKDEETEKVQVINAVLEVYVDVKGAVKNPGVYKVNTDTIINDVIKMAGGFKSNAYKNGINLSKKVTDEMVIFVYTVDEIKKYNQENDIKDEVVTIKDVPCLVSDYNIWECTEKKESIIETDINKPTNKPSVDEDKTEEVDKTQEGTNKLINLNTATKEELITLTGIGEAKALAIIQYRTENGNFTKIEDIMNVSGIGEKAFEKIKEFITV